MPEKSSARKQCFVVGPIGGAGTDIRTQADWLLDGIIIPVFDEHFSDFQVTRSDKISKPGMIDSQMITHLLEDELVIADMTFQNANAFYEMGIRHMTFKPIIHMFAEGQDIPFDVKPHRAIPFSVAHPAHLVAARAELKAAIDETLAEGFVVENPVSRARGIQKLLENTSPELSVITDQMNNIQERLSSLEAARRSSPPIKNYAAQLDLLGGAVAASGHVTLIEIRVSPEITVAQRAVIEQQISTLSSTFGEWQQSINEETIGISLDAMPTDSRVASLISFARALPYVTNVTVSRALKRSAWSAA